MHVSLQIISLRFAHSDFHLFMLQIYRCRYNFIFSPKWQLWEAMNEIRDET